MSIRWASSSGAPLVVLDMLVDVRDLTAWHQLMERVEQLGQTTLEVLLRRAHEGPDRAIVGEVEMQLASGDAHARNAVALLGAVYLHNAEVFVVSPKVERYYRVTRAALEGAGMPGLNPVTLAISGHLTMPHSFDHRVPRCSIGGALLADVSALAHLRQKKGTMQEHCDFISKLTDDALEADERLTKEGVARRFHRVFPGAAAAEFEAARKQVWPEEWKRGGRIGKLRKRR